MRLGTMIGKTLISLRTLDLHQLAACSGFDAVFNALPLRPPKVGEGLVFLTQAAKQIGGTKMIRLSSIARCWKAHLVIHGSKPNGQNIALGRGCKRSPFGRRKTSTGHCVRSAETDVLGRNSRMSAGLK